MLFVIFISLYIFYFLFMLVLFFVFFFFSSRRRHTRWNCDWSSDVCSSDLLSARDAAPIGGALRPNAGASPCERPDRRPARGRRRQRRRSRQGVLRRDQRRSEERRVGKECRSRWSPYP